MKPFVQYVSEDYDSHQNVPKEIYDANDHLADMVSLDTHFREKYPNTPGFPLLYNMHVLTAIHNLYLGVKHPAKYPDHALKTKEYSDTIEQYTPHLKPYMTHPSSKS